MIKELFAEVKQRGVRTITCHGSVSLGNMVQELDSLGLLDEHIIISHRDTIETAQAERIKAKGASISSTPSTELQMATGRPYCFDAAFIDQGPTGDSIRPQENFSLRINCHTATGAFIPIKARNNLQNARHTFREHYLKQDKLPSTMSNNLGVEAAFNLATVKGAEAVRMSHGIGRIAEGFKADLVIFDTLSPSMIGAAQHDPVAAIILHLSSADVELVIVDGIFRKRDGNLYAVEVDASAKAVTDRQRVDWMTVPKEIVSRRERIQQEIDKISFEEASSALLKLFRIDGERLVAVK